MAERLWGFLAWHEMRRLRVREFFASRVAIAAAAAWISYLSLSANGRGRLDLEAVAALAAWFALLSLLGAGPLLVVLGFAQMRASGTAELLLAAGVPRRGLVAGVWLGRLWSLLLLAAGGVGALGALLVFGSLELRALADLAAYLALAALSITALALPAAAAGPRHQWLGAYVPPLLLHGMPSLLGSVLTGSAELFHQMGALAHPVENALVQTLSPPVAAVVHAGAMTALPEIVGPAATDPAGALRRVALLHVPLAAVCFVCSCWRLRCGASAPSNGRTRPTRHVGAQHPVSWLLAPRDRFAQARAGLWFVAAAAALPIAQWAFGWTNSGPLLTAFATAVFAAALGIGVRAGFALCGAAPTMRLIAGLPLDPNAVLTEVHADLRGRFLLFMCAAALGLACAAASNPRGAACVLWGSALGLLAFVVFELALAEGGVAGGASESYGAAFGQYALAMGLWLALPLPAAGIAVLAMSYFPGVAVLFGVVAIAACFGGIGRLRHERRAIGLLARLYPVATMRGLGTGLQWRAALKNEPDTAAGGRAE